MRPTLSHVVGAIGLVAAVAAGIYRSNVHERTFGDDFDIICAAGEVLDQSGNPYHLATLEAVSGLRGLVMSYPPSTPLILRPVCGRVGPLWMILAGTVVLLVLTSRLPGVGVAPAAWAIVSGFAAFPWLVLTGNIIAILEGFCGLAAVWAIARSRPAAFGAAIGIAAFLKVQPAAYLLAAFVRWPVRQAGGAAASALGVFAGLHLLTLAGSPRAFGHYWDAVASGWDGLVQAEIRFGSENNPSMFAFLPIVMEHIGAGAMAGYALGALVAVGFAAVWFWRWRGVIPSEMSRIWMTLLAMGVIALLYPRFKPYTIVLLLPALAMILSGLRGPLLSGALLLSSVLPNVALIGMTYLATSTPVPVPVLFALQYAQWVLLAAAMAAALCLPVPRELARPLT